MPERQDVVVLGGGPGGYVAAIRAAHLGLKVALVEKEALGGLCLNWGCIPSKSLLRNAEVVSLLRRAEEFGIALDGFQPDMAAAVARSRRVVQRLVKGVESLMRKNHITVVQGVGALRDAHTVEIAPQGELVQAGSVILATGARDRALPSLPVDGQTIITSRHALEVRQPPQRLVIVGGGPVGVEFASYFAAYGSQVTVVEMMPHLLPAEDAEVAELLERSFQKEGIQVLTSARVERLAKDRKRQPFVEVSTEAGPRELPYDQVLVAIGFEGNVEGLGLERVGVRTEKGFVEVDGRMATSVPGVYAVGDVTGPPLLAHVAEAKGVAAAEAIAGRPASRLVLENMPRAVYSRPQVASIGLTEAQAQERGLAVQVGRFPFRANGKALALADYEGLVKVVSDARSGAILGAQMVGPECSELLGELSLALALEATPADLGRAVHPHPTLSEALMEAALAAEGQAIHI